MDNRKIRIDLFFLNNFTQLQKNFIFFFNFTLKNEGISMIEYMNYISIKKLYFCQYIYYI